LRVTHASVLPVVYDSASSVLHAPAAIAKAAVKHVESFEMAYKRFRRIRAENAALGSQVPQTFAHKMDKVLSRPECFKNSGMRWLVGSAKVFEELAESCGESNAYIERLVRNLLSAGNKNNFTHMVGGGVGRVVTGLWYAPGFAVHKVAGAGFYGLSLLATFSAMALSTTSYGEQASPAQLQRNLAKSHFDSSIYSVVSSSLEKTRSLLLGRLAKSPIFNQGKLGKFTKGVSNYYSRSPAYSVYVSARSRRGNSDYMWKHRHQYGAITKALLNVSYYTLLGVNRLGGSYDKYLGSFLAKQFLSRYVGQILGNRLGLSVGIALSAGLSVLISPLVIGTSTVAAAACAFSLLMLLAAKSNVLLGGDWKGDIEPYSKRLPQQIKWQTARLS
jgi:hypothetical protein